MKSILLTESDEAHSLVDRVAQLALGECGFSGSCPKYLTALRYALKEEPPPFETAGYRDLYRASAGNAGWLAISLITNAEREGDGARRLWSLAACSTNEFYRQQLKQHAVDESRHALLYLSILDITFPGATAPDFRSELNSLSPGFKSSMHLFPVPGSPYSKPATLDDFIQMNIAEIRTTIHHFLQREAITHHCTTDNARRITSTQDSLLRDELRHVSYTARIIEELIGPLRADSAVTSLFIRRFRDFNSITREELGDGKFDCSVACCAKRPWCRAKSATLLSLN